MTLADETAVGRVWKRRHPWRGRDVRIVVIRGGGDCVCTVGIGQKSPTFAMWHVDVLRGFALKPPPAPKPAPLHQNTPDRRRAP